MIYFVNGRPGGGKSLFMAEKIYKKMKRGVNVIANFEINMDYFKNCRHPEKLGKFIYVSNAELTTQAYLNIDPREKRFSYIDGLWGFALNFHLNNRRKDGSVKEHQTILVLDECGVLFNSRTFSSRDRLSWLDFFINHRKLAYDVYLIAQDEKQIDKQIREMFQKETECRDISKIKIFGKFLSLLAGGSLFVRITRDYTLMSGFSKKNARESARYYTGRKYFRFYDSYKLFGRPADDG